MNETNKPSSADLKTEKKLLHFGLDYLILNICSKADTNSETAQFLNAIFSMDHNTTNSNTIGNFVWAESMQEVRIIFSESPDGEVAQIHQGEHYLFQIAQIDHKSPKWKNTNYQYKYRVQFYGDFFNQARREVFDSNDFFEIFLKDIETSQVINSLSRIDICADIACIRPEEIYKGVKGTHLKLFSEFGKSKKTGEMETFYYGKKLANSSWFIRCYDKLADSRKKRKEKLYKDYFFYKNVTRIEAEMKSDTLRAYQVNLLKIQDINFIWSIYARLLKTKYNSWAILPFLKRELKKWGFKKIPLEKRNHQIIPLEREQYAKRLLSTSETFFERYENNPAIHILSKMPHLQDETLKYLTKITLRKQVRTKVHFQIKAKQGTIQP